jgi:hypothetical protein
MSKDLRGLAQHDQGGNLHLRRVSPQYFLCMPVDWIQRRRGLRRLIRDLRALGMPPIRGVAAIDVCFDAQEHREAGLGHA